MTFFDPISSSARAVEMARIWACGSYAEVLRLEAPCSSARIDLARRSLEHLLHPSHNEFQGCSYVMEFVKQAAEGLLSKAEFRNMVMM